MDEYIQDWLDDIIDVTLQRYNVSLTVDQKVNEFAISAYEVFYALTKVNWAPHFNPLKTLEGVV